MAAVGRLVALCARLGPRDGATCLLAWTLLQLTVLRLKLVPFGRPLPDPARPRPTAPVGPDPDVTRLVHLFHEAARHSAVGCWCLPRAVALRGFLGLHGHRAELALGLRHEAEGLGGHAWVVYHGAALTEDAAFLGSFTRCEVS